MLCLVRFIPENQPTIECKAIGFTPMEGAMDALRLADRELPDETPVQVMLDCESGS